MKIKTYLILPMLLLLSAPVIAVENSGQGDAKPPHAMRNTVSSATLTANTAAQPATANVVDKVDTYIPHPDEVAAQQQAR
jgi:hypothetical protein